MFLFTEIAKCLHIHFFVDMIYIMIIKKKTSNNVYSVKISDNIIHYCLYSVHCPLYSTSIKTTTLYH